METEENTKAYKLSQDGHDYIATLGIIQTFLHVTCQENIGINDNFYEATFSLDELVKISRFFLLTTSIFEAQVELEKAIEKQQVGLEATNDTFQLIFYMTIGTDKIFLKLPLKKSDNVYKKFRNAEEQVILKGQLNMQGRGGNYPFDEQRINIIDSIKNDLVISQEGLVCDIRRLLSLTDKLLKDTSFLSEENAKLQVRLNKIRKENNDRSNEIDELIAERKILTEENQQLLGETKDLENKLNSKKEILNKNLHESKAKSVLANDLDFGKGPKAISSRFDDTQVRTFVPRPTNKPDVISYDSSKRSTTYRAINRDNRDRNNLTYTYGYNNNGITQVEPKTPKQHSNYDFNNYINNNALANNGVAKKLPITLSPAVNNETQFGKTLDVMKPHSLMNIAFNNERIETVEIYRKGDDNSENGYNNNINHTYNVNKPNFNNPENLNKKTNSTNKQQKNYIYDEILVPTRITEKTNDYEEDIPNKNEKTGKEALKSKISLNSEVEVESAERNINVINSDIIINSAEEDMIINKIQKNGNKIQFNLIYKATVDSDRASVFHDKCDFAEKTLILIDTIEGKRFGGYTSVSWDGDCVEKEDKKAFIFSLDKLQIYGNIPGQKAIGCYPKFGPVFMGCQIKINDNFFVKGGTTFRKNANFATNNDYELTDGSKFFGVKDIEVFEVLLI